MATGYKKINFETLHKLVADIDYVAENTFPVVFLVSGRKYICGIEATNEQQFLIDEDSNVLDLQEPDNMNFDQIGKMLKEKCDFFFDLSDRITLATPKSFTGEKLNLDKQIKKYKNALAREERKKTKLLQPVTFTNHEEAVQTVYNKVLRKAGRPFGCTVMTNYYRIDPKPVKLDDGNVLNVEWLQPSSFTVDVLINWRTDRVKATSLSTKELEQLAVIV